MSVEIIVSLLQTIILLLIAPMISGIVGKFKAWMQHRKGASIFQPYRDLIKLVKKDEVVSESTSWLFRVIPYVCFATMVVLACMIPFMFTGVLAPFGDLISLVYILTLYRFAMVLGGLEGGSVFGGMGSSREMMMSVLIEPAMLLALMAICVLSGSETDISEIPRLLCTMGLVAISPALILGAASFMMTLLAENARIPFDNPSTHLELTMIHESMLLEYSGRGLAMMEYSAQLRLAIFMTMLGTIFLPWGISLDTDIINLLIGLVVIILKLVLFSFILALVESCLNKTRLFKIPNLLTVSFVLGLLAVISSYIL